MEVDGNGSEGNRREKLCHGVCVRLPEVAQHTVPADFSMDTKDYEDHTFSGIMFTVQAKEVSTVPVQFVEIQSVSVRGDLGDVSVYYCWDGYEHKNCSPSLWTEVYRNFLGPSMRRLCELRLAQPIRLFPGQKIGLYVHSRASGDDAIVYGDKHAEVTHEDLVLKVLPGIAHTGNVPFSLRGMWGYNGWRSPRQFVGNIKYGIKYFLWRPLSTLHQNFPGRFRSMVKTMLLCHASNSGTLCMLPKDIVFYIINFCPYNWVGDLLEEEQSIHDEGQTEVNSWDLGVRDVLRTHWNWRTLFRAHPQIEQYELEEDGEADSDYNDDDDRSLE